MVLVFVANGFEELEVVGTVDILKRAGLDVKTVSLEDTVGVSSSTQMRIYTDWTTSVIAPKNDAYEMVVLPGGMPGAENLYNSAFVKECTEYVFSKGLPVAAICAAPFALGKWGLLRGKKATCYPGFEKELLGAEYVDRDVVTDGNVITANGPASTLKFAYALVEKLCGKETADDIRRRMMY